jgi:hypothetical protein
MSTSLNPWVLARADTHNRWQIIGRFRSYTQAIQHGDMVGHHQLTATTIWYEILSLDWFEDEIEKVRLGKQQWINALKRISNGKPTDDLIGINASNLKIVDCQIEIAYCDRVMLKLLDSLIYWSLSRGLWLDVSRDRIEFIATRPESLPLWRAA